MFQTTNQLNISIVCWHHRKALLDATSACRRFFDFEDLQPRRQVDAKGAGIHHLCERWRQPMDDKICM